ncbi:hypothetical protein O181_001418 [Austropuccinia psidii MF-1]|uniref:Uncharacterized protein n=1 Tax=Austropuccinia psidii MF-1 TaxID=1389203 RepID=A0A9Q3BAH2_9BASI|nr:hypothetical protein [Austropuccinia psidii MF-1]
MTTFKSATTALKTSIAATTSLKTPIAAMTAPNLFCHLTPPHLQVPSTIYNLSTSPMSFLIIVSFLNHYYFLCTFLNLLNIQKPQQTMNPSTIASEAPSVDNQTMFQYILSID